MSGGRGWAGEGKCPLSRPHPGGGDLLWPIRTWVPSKDGRYMHTFSERVTLFSVFQDQNYHS